VGSSSFRGGGEKGGEGFLLLKSPNAINNPSPPGRENTLPEGTLIQYNPLISSPLQKRAAYFFSLCPSSGEEKRKKGEEVV